ncbi:hypothetical protein PIB30_044660 [Stylosanthes scabra]|uniref:Uncharacterized protein n=1 Tax=Stylosanthes scabra TaxID=79078 RepID=A0ABU6ZEN7_9FABA|nr:hypothetical protein [Stylosanthes scabra]
MCRSRDRVEDQVEETPLQGDDMQSWNIRGVANNATIRTLKELRNQKKPDISLLFETRCSGDRAQEVIRSLGFRGIWVLRDSDQLHITTIEKFHQYIHLNIETPWRKILDPYSNICESSGEH